MQKLLKVISLCILALTLTRCAGKPFFEKSESIPFAGNIVAERFLLPNGLKLIVVEDPSSPTFAYQTWFKVGSKNEVPQYTGLAHFFEHMMFKGTTAYPEGQFDKILDGAGAQGMNASTGHDATRYVQQLPSDKLELIAQLESDRLVNLVINEESFRTEREVILNELRYRVENNPSGQMQEALMALAYQKHPYQWPVGGYVEDLKRMNASDGVAFYKRYYRPDNATIVIVGDVKPRDAYKIVKQYYGKIKNEPVAPLSYQPKKEPLQKSARKKTLRLNINVEQLMMAYAIPGVNDPDNPVFEVIQGILSEGRSSRLVKALVDSGIASQVSTGSFQNEDPTLFLAAASLQNGKTAAQAEDIILRHIAKLTQKQVSEEELQRAKNVISFGFYHRINSNMGKADFIGNYETNAGDFRKGLQIQAGIERVTAADVLRVAKKYLAESNRTTIQGIKK